MVEPGPDLEAAKARKLRARIFNERVKLLVAGLHALSLALFGGAVIVPGLANVGSLFGFEPLAVGAAALALHLLAQAILGSLRSEE